MSRHHKNEHHLQFYKMAAQAIGLMVCFIFIFFIINTGFSDSIKNDRFHLMIFLLLIGIPIIGYCTTWFKELPGAFLMVAGGIAIIFYFFLTEALLTGLIHGALFIFSGSLFFLHLNKRKKLKRKRI